MRIKGLLGTARRGGGRRLRRRLALSFCAGLAVQAARASFWEELTEILDCLSPGAGDQGAAVQAQNNLQEAQAIWQLIQAVGLDPGGAGTVPRPGPRAPIGTDPGTDLEMIGLTVSSLDVMDQDDAQWVQFASVVGGWLLRSYVDGRRTQFRSEDQMATRALREADAKYRDTLEKYQADMQQIGQLESQLRQLDLESQEHTDAVKSLEGILDTYRRDNAALQQKLWEIERDTRIIEEIIEKSQNQQSREVLALEGKLEELIKTKLELRALIETTLNYQSQLINPGL